MIDKVECPFCGVSFEPITHPTSSACPLSGYGFSTMQWNKRPPRKEQPAMPVTAYETIWLRGLVERFISMKVVQATLPNNVKVSEGKEE